VKREEISVKRRARHRWGRQGARDVDRNSRQVDSGQDVLVRLEVQVLAEPSVDFATYDRVAYGVNRVVANNGIHQRQGSGRRPSSCDVGETAGLTGATLVT